ncbi:YkvA family protein [Neobacillus ginsengisoli]|uniref:Uncharacterized membrane protein YkvA (DUF1232 family) n=1 Tax=Neobacillus ginsengisoli TaxID=904295 RepID=A0ABT9XS30_9BACI|nr:YkvA family protein [Neobacillus ginsengisoli]MDQ0198353.1 uncharacterized membrane protein YkvA (DUF1232 family) [Neobacillus ginsengisoli]
MFEIKEPNAKTRAKYEDKAKDYLNNPEKTEGLLSKAIKKANKRKGTLGEAWDKLQLFLELIKSYSKGEYKNVSNSTLLTVIGAVLYFVSPIDVIPDFIVGIGIVDDAAVIGYTIKKVSKELDEYKKWKKLISSS